jgi:hypothetical protein
MTRARKVATFASIDGIPTTRVALARRDLFSQILANARELFAIATVIVELDRLTQMAVITRAYGTWRRRNDEAPHERSEDQASAELHAGLFEPHGNTS